MVGADNPHKISLKAVVCAIESVENGRASIEEAKKAFDLAKRPWSPLTFPDDLFLMLLTRLNDLRQMEENNYDEWLKANPPSGDGVDEEPVPGEGLPVDGDGSL